MVCTKLHKSSDMCAVVIYAVKNFDVLSNRKVLSICISNILD